MVEPCAAAYQALMLREAPTRMTMIDPNIRPGFITDEAAYRARLTSMFAVADIVKTSDEDLEWITGGTDASVLFEGTSVQIILLTKGSEGVTVLTRDGSVDVPAVRRRSSIRLALATHLARDLGQSRRTRLAHQGENRFGNDGRVDPSRRFRRQGRGDHRVAQQGQIRLGRLSFEGTCSKGQPCQRDG